MMVVAAASSRVVRIHNQQPARLFSRVTVQHWPSARNNHGSSITRALQDSSARCSIWQVPQHGFYYRGGVLSYNTFFVGTKQQ